MLKKIGCFLWILLAVGCMAAAARYYEDIGRSTTKEAFIVPSLVILFWVFIILGIGGKKGVPFVAGMVTFVACSIGFIYFINRLPEFYGCGGLNLKNNLRAFNACAERAFQYKPFRAYGVLAAAALALLAIPFLTAFVGIKVNSIVKWIDDWINKKKAMRASASPGPKKRVRLLRGWRGPGVRRR